MESHSVKPDEQQLNESSMNHDTPQECTLNSRRFERFEFETDLTATMLGVERGEAVRGCSLNINEAGIAGVFATEWDVGASVNLQFAVPFASAPVRARAVIRNRMSYRYGFEFVELSSEHRSTITGLAECSAYFYRGSRHARASA